ncbi:MAG: hypothetical protein AAF490_05730 [Chloroflexota bacterium]
MGNGLRLTFDWRELDRTDGRVRFTPLPRRVEDVPRLAGRREDVVRLLDLGLPRGLLLRFDIDYSPNTNFILIVTVR